MLQGRITPLPGTELRLVSLNKRQQNEKAFSQKYSWRAHVSPMFLRFPYGKYCFCCKLLLPRCKLCLCYTAGNFSETPSMEAMISNCKHFESTSKRALVLFLRANWSKAKFREQFQIEWDYSIPLTFYALQNIILYLAWLSSAMGKGTQGFITLKMGNYLFNSTCCHL